MRSNSFIFIFSFITVTVFADIGVNFGANSNPILKAGETEVTSETALDDDVLVQLLPLLERLVQLDLAEL